MPLCVLTSMDVFGIHGLSIFIVASLTLIVTPGQDTFYILGRSIAQGRVAGVLSAIGVSCGILVHTFLAAFGLSAILAASSLAFQTIKYLGAAYLVYLGVRLLLSSRRPKKAEGEEARMSHWAILRQGVLSNVLNPKVALFFMAYLPQFVEPSQASQALPFLILGGLFVTMGFIWVLFIAWFAASVSGLLRSRPSVHAWLERFSGTVFIAMGLRIAVAANER